MGSLNRQADLEAVETLELRMRDLENTLHEFTSRVEEVQGRLAAVQRERATIVNRLAPINKLPDELLVEIWNRCHHPSSFPFVVSWVTRRWRNVAIDTPTLWCDILVFPKQSIQVVEAQLIRSKKCTLAVTALFEVDGCSGVVGRRHTRTENLMAIISPHIYRLGIFRLCIEDWHASRGGSRFVGMILRPFRDACAPRLTELLIKCSLEDWIHSEFVHSQNVLAGGTPMLSQVTLHGMDKRVNSRLLTGLTTLDIKDLPFRVHITHAEFRDILAASPFLTHLTIRGVCVEYDPPPVSDWPSIHVPSLRSLTINGECEDEDYANFITLFFPVFKTPGLETLALEQMSPWAIEAFYSTISDSPVSKYPVVSKLCLFDAMFQNNPYTVGFFLRLASIDHLQFNYQFNYHGMGDDLVKVLTSYAGTPGSEAKALCPRLQTLTWKWCSATTKDRIKLLMSKRSSMGYPISHLRVEREGFETLEPKDQEWFRDNVDLKLYESLE